MNKQEKIYFTREYKGMLQVFKKCEIWFNKKSTQEKLEALYDAYIVSLFRKKGWLK